jgi:hypothetical protein
MWRAMSECAHKCCWGRHAEGLFERIAHPRYPSGCGSFIGTQGGASTGVGFDGDRLG